METKIPINEKSDNIKYHFYCQNLCGDEDFSIEEWNKAYDEVKDKSEEIQRMVLDPPKACNKQCFNCLAIVGATRKKTNDLIKKIYGI